jgi:hypothetical protein
VWLYDRTQSNCHRFHVYARHDVTENTALVAKLIASFPTYGSLVRFCRVALCRVV